MFVLKKHVLSKCFLYNLIALAKTLLFWQSVNFFNGKYVSSYCQFTVYEYSTLDNPLKFKG